MKLPELSYLRASSLEDAVDALSSEEDAHALAGGQSLVPLLALRLARPSLLVDLGSLGLGTLVLEDGAAPSDPGRLRLGALVRQRRLELDPQVEAACPLLSEAARLVGYPATRNLGTLGGSLAHADPSAELAAAVVALGGEVVASGPHGPRTLPVAELFDGYFATTLRAGEVLTEISVRRAGPRHGAAFCEWARRPHDFAEAGVGVAVELDASGACSAVYAGACAVADRPLDLGAELAAAGVLGASSITQSLLGSVAAAVEVAAAAAGEDRAELCGLLAARATLSAFRHAGRAGRAGAGSAA